MPNWVRTRLTFNGEKNRVAEIKELVKTTGKDDEDVAIQMSSTLTRLYLCQKNWILFLLCLVNVV